MSLSYYPFPSLDWEYQGFDFAGLADFSQDIAYRMYDDGVRFVGRYLFPYQYPTGKGISPTEAEYYLNAGIRIFLYYEVYATDALDGYEQGQINGENCLQLAQSLSVPAGTQIYCCCDTGVTDAQASGVVMDYLNGFASAMPDYNVGIYGGQNVVSSCYDLYPEKYRCQAGAWGFQEFDPINIRQWMYAFNRSAFVDGKVRINNINIDGNGYATWRGRPVDIVSANTLANMWGDGSPTPPPPTPPGPSPYSDSSIPIWFYLKQF